MKSEKISSQFTPETILQNTIKILENMTSDWDMEFTGPIGLDTRLIGDLAFESIDVVQFIVQLETNFHRKDLPFEKLLMTDGRYREDFTVREVVGFLNQYL